jgi:hypothetical protein
MLARLYLKPERSHRQKRAAGKALDPMRDYRLIIGIYFRTDP